MEENNNEGLSQSANDFKKESKRYNIALEIAEGDDQKARELMREEKNIINIKARFFEETRKIYGLTSIFYNKKDKMLLNKISLVNEKKETFSISPFMNWEDFRKKLEKSLLYGEGKLSLINDINGKIDEIINFTNRDESAHIFEEENNKVKLDDLILRILFEAFSTQHFEIESAIEHVNIVDFYVSEDTRIKGAEENAEADEEENEEEKGPSETVIEISPVLSPIHGVLIAKLKEGDVIFIRVIDESIEGISYLSEMKAKYEMENPKIPVAIKSIKHTGKETIIYVNLKEGLLGKIFEVDPVKVMTVEPKKAEKEATNEKDELKARNTMKIFVFAASALLVLSAVVIITLALSGGF